MARCTSKLIKFADLATKRSKKAFATSNLVAQSPQAQANHSSSGADSLRAHRPAFQSRQVPVKANAGSLFFLKSRSATTAATTTKPISATKTTVDAWTALIPKTHVDGPAPAVVLESNALFGLRKHKPIPEFYKSEPKLNLSHQSSPQEPSAIVRSEKALNGPKSVPLAKVQLKCSVTPSKVTCDKKKMPPPLASKRKLTSTEIAFTLPMIKVRPRIQVHLASPTTIPEKNVIARTPASSVKAELPEVVSTASLKTAIKVTQSSPQDIAPKCSPSSSSPSPFLPAFPSAPDKTSSKDSPSSCLPASVPCQEKSSATAKPETKMRRAIDTSRNKAINAHHFYGITREFDGFLELHHPPAQKRKGRKAKRAKS